MKARHPMVRYLAWILVFSTGWIGVLQPRAQAMLIPAQAQRASQEETSRGSDLQVVDSALANKAIREKLHALGLSDQEIQSRLSRLSDRQVHQLASQIRAVNPAGEGVIIGLLVIVVLVLLIIFLAKRV